MNEHADLAVRAERVAVALSVYTEEAPAHPSEVCEGVMGSRVADADRLKISKRKR